jgi:hypothetical protein
MLLRALSKAKAKSQSAYCLNSDKQLTLAASLYAQGFQRPFPAGPLLGQSLGRLRTHG